MKILFSGDWHIKLGQKNVPKDWQINRYKLLFEKLHDLEDRADLHIIGGDIFDRVPKPDELELYFQFIKGCKIQTEIYDGNHEATRKGQTFLTHLSSVTTHINDMVYIVSGIVHYGDFDIIPYTHLKTFTEADQEADLLFTHVRGSIPPHVIPEIDLDKFKPWRTVVAGDLHSYENSQRNILYPGSPLSITFHRNPIRNGVLIFDTDTHTHEWIDLGLPQLIRKTVEKEEEIVKTDYDHTIYEVTGNILELSEIDTTSDLVDKKIVKKESSSALDLHGLTVTEELDLYLNKIVKLDKDEAADTMRVFNDNYKGYEMG